MACESRVSNFTRSWPRTAGNLTPQHMALAGFFYTGHLARVQCFICQCQINAWLPDDDPMVEHQRRFPDCPIVKDYERFQEVVSGSNMPMVSWGADIPQGYITTAATLKDLGSSMRQEHGWLSEVGQPIVADSFSSMNESDMDELRSILEGLNTSIGDANTSKQDSVGTTVSEEMAASDSQVVPKSKAAGGSIAGKTLCSSCMDKVKSIAFIPCCHVTCCTNCAYHVNTCPLCKKTIQNRLKIRL